MVIFQSSEGTPGYHQTESLDDAVSFVEGLRNDQEVERARIFRMEEVPFEFRPYFRVELGKGSTALRVRSFDLGDGESIDLTEELARERSRDLAPSPEVIERETEAVADALSSSVVTRRGLFGR